MRYKRQLLDMLIKYEEEEKVIEYRKEIEGTKDMKAFYNMDIEKFNRILNTLGWLVKQGNKYVRIDNDIKKPTDSEILEAMEDMEKVTIQLLEWAKVNKDLTVRKKLMTIGRNKLNCVKYYKQLVKEDYFKDK